jgi:hypothetical protein
MKEKAYYLAGILFLIIGFYHIYIVSYLEAAMYLSLCLGFLLTGMVKNDLFQNRQKLLGAVSWIMIFIALFIFLFLLRTDMK